MIKYRKKKILELCGEPKFIHHEATVTHNEVTVAIVTYHFNVHKILSRTFYETAVKVLDISEKVIKSFQDVSNIRLSLNPEALNYAIQFQVKAKTERRSEDTHDQKYADKLVLSKANAKAGRVAQRILFNLIEEYNKVARTATEAMNIVTQYTNREAKYINKTLGLYK